MTTLWVGSLWEGLLVRIGLVWTSLWVGLSVGFSAEQPPSAQWSFQDWLLVLEKHPQLIASRAGVKEALYARGAEQALWLPRIQAQAEWGAVRYPVGLGIGQSDTRHRYVLRWDQVIWNRPQSTRLRQSEELVQLAHARLADQWHDLGLQLFERYIDLLAAYQDCRFARARWETVSRQYASIRSLVAAGVAAQVDEWDAQASQDAAHIAQLQAEKNWLYREAAWRRLVQQSVTRLADLPPLEDELAVKAVFQKLTVPNWPMLEQEVFARHAALRVAATQLQAAEIRVSEMRNTYWPQLGFFAEYETLRGGLSRAFRNDAERWTFSRRVGLAGSWIWDLNGVFAARVSSANAEQAAVWANQESIKRSIHQSLYKEYVVFTATPAQLQALRQAMHSAQLEYESVRAAYRAGLRTAVDVLGEISRVVDAERKYRQRQYDHVRSWLRIQRMRAAEPRDWAMVLDGVFPCMQHVSHKQAASTRQKGILAPESRRQDPY